jgi:hypothetical protein
MEAGALHGPKKHGLDGLVLIEDLLWDRLAVAIDVRHGRAPEQVLVALLPSAVAADHACTCPVDPRSPKIIDPPSRRLSA